MMPVSSKVEFEEKAKPLKRLKTYEEAAEFHPIINAGYGDYLVFSETSAAEGPKKIDEKTFKLAYQVLNQFNPNIALQSERIDTALEKLDPDKRFTLLSLELQKIDPSLKAIFIPKTLYELFILYKSLKEDFKSYDVCPNSYALFENSYNLDDVIEAVSRTKREECFHYLISEGSTNLIVTNDDKKMIHVANLVNQAALKTLIREQNEGFTLPKIKEKADELIRGIKFFTEKLSEDNRLISSIHTLTSGFVNKDTSHDLLASYSIREKGSGIDIDLLHQLIELECSDLAKNSILLYRGSFIKKDNVFVREKDIEEAYVGSLSDSEEDDVESLSDSEEDDDSEASLDEVTTIHSLSYGTSLFAGISYDPTATAWLYMTDRSESIPIKLIPHVIHIPFSEVERSPFYIPPFSTLAQFFSSGEFFHARTKLPSNLDDEDVITGIHGLNKFEDIKKDPKYKFLESGLDLRSLVKLYKRYKRGAKVRLIR